MVQEASISKAEAKGVKVEAKGVKVEAEDFKVEAKESKAEAKVFKVVAHLRMNLVSVYAQTRFLLLYNARIVSRQNRQIISHSKTKAIISGSGKVEKSVESTQGSANKVRVCPTG